MSTLFFYNVNQNPSDAQRIIVNSSMLDEVDGLLSSSSEEDNCGNKVAYVEDIGHELEEVLDAVKASPERIAELLSCELITTSTLCN